jgi:hypothetical protein
MGVDAEGVEPDGDAVEAGQVDGVGPGDEVGASAGGQEQQGGGNSEDGKEGGLGHGVAAAPRGRLR